jgi:hypothetical protein
MAASFGGKIHLPRISSKPLLNVVRMVFALISNMNATEYMSKSPIEFILALVIFMFFLFQSICSFDARLAWIIFLFASHLTHIPNKIWFSNSRRIRFTCFLVSWHKQTSWNLTDKQMHSETMQVKYWDFSELCCCFQYHGETNLLRDKAIE